MCQCTDVSHSLKGSVGVGVEVGCCWSMRERFCTLHFMQSNPSAGWLSLASTHWHKSIISLINAVNLAWLLAISSLGWSPASGPPKATVVFEPLVLSLSLSGPVFMPSMSYEEIDVSVYGTSCTSVVGSHNMCLVHSAISLISISDLSEHSLE